MCLRLFTHSLSLSLPLSFSPILIRSLLAPHQKAPIRTVRILINFVAFLSNSTCLPRQVPLLLVVISNYLRLFSSLSLVQLFGVFSLCFCVRVATTLEPKKRTQKASNPIDKIQLKANQNKKEWNANKIKKIRRNSTCRKKVKLLCANASSLCIYRFTLFLSLYRLHGSSNERSSHFSVSPHKKPPG